MTRHSALYRGSWSTPAATSSRGARSAIRSTSPRSISTSCPRSTASCGCSRTAGANLFALHERDYAGGAARPARRGRRGRSRRTPCPPPRPPGSSRTCASPATCSTRSASSSTTTPSGALTSVIAEVNNTYGGRYRYVLGPAQRVLAPAGSRRIGFRHARELFVSPFLHGPRSYEFWFDAPLDGDQLAITMHVDTPGGDRVFTAHLAGTRRALTDRALAVGGGALPVDDRAGDRPHPPRGAEAAARRRAVPPARPRPPAARLDPPTPATPSPRA